MFAPKVNWKLVFFDRSVIRSNWKQMNRGPLSRAGLLVRRIARSSIRRGPKRLKGGKPPKPSQPGSPPKSRVEGKTPPFKMIFSVPNRLGTSVVVGMVGFGGKAEPVPGLHEHGGVTTAEVLEKIAETRRDSRGKFLRQRRRRVTKTVRYAPRPFMFPALLKGRSKMPQLWKNSLSR